MVKNYFYGKKIFLMLKFFLKTHIFDSKRRGILLWLDEQHIPEQLDHHL